MVDASHDDVRCLFDSGWTLQKEGRIDDAIACFTRVLDMEPDFVKAFYARGACHNIKGEYTRAIDDYTVALEKDVWQRRQRIYTCASQGGLRGHPCSSRCPEQEMAIREVTSSTTTPSPNVTRADNESSSSLEPSEGQQRTPRKEPPQAKDAMREARLPETTMTPALSCRIPDGEDHIWQEIEETTLRLIRQPTDVITRCRRADLFSQVGELREALFDYTEALIHRPDDAALYYNRGILHDDCRQFDEARQDFTAAIQLDPNQPDFFNNRGLCYRKQGQLHRALEDYAKALDLKPDHPYAQTNQRIAHSLLYRGDEVL